MIDVKDLSFSYKNSKGFSLNKLNFIKGKEMLVSESIASRILCLPLYTDISIETIDIICEIINNEIC